MISQYLPSYREGPRSGLSRCCPDVLYSCLLDDLQSVLPLDVIRLELAPPDVSPREFAAFALSKSFYKKFIDKTLDSADATALKKFTSVNHAVGEWDLSLDNSGDEVLYGELKRSLYDFFSPGGYPLIDSFEQILAHGYTGPGASVGARGYDFYTKLFSSPLSVTDDFLYKAYKSYAFNFPEWHSAEVLRKCEFGEASIVEGNRLRFVPKRVDVSRVICIEPNLNMFYQLGVKQILEKRLKSVFGIDLSCQQFKNRELARVGSLNDSYVTIDLSNASDSIGYRMLRDIVPSSFFTWLDLLRSKRCLLPNGEQLELNMISTMGNGFTFPLQTILFSCVVVAAARVANRPLVFPYGKALGSFGVNGDDIVCEKEISRGVMRLLSILGFSVNYDKTFVEGPFRESCGHDYYHGLNVRGVYIKTLKTEASRYAAINALNSWTQRTGIPLPCAVQYLHATTRALFVPPWEQEDSGIKVPWSYAKGLRKSKHLQSVLYRKLVPSKLTLTVLDRKIKVPAGQKTRIYNPSGLFVSFLQGCITSGKIGVRLDTNLYRTKWAVAPNWERQPDNSVFATEQERSSWETACSLNLGLE